MLFVMVVIQFLQFWAMEKLLYLTGFVQGTCVMNTWTASLMYKLLTGPPGSDSPNQYKFHSIVSILHRNVPIMLILEPHWAILQYFVSKISIQYKSVHVRGGLMDLQY